MFSVYTDLSRLKIEPESSLGGLGSAVDYSFDDNRFLGVVMGDMRGGKIGMQVRIYGDNGRDEQQAGKGNVQGDAAFA